MKAEEKLVEINPNYLCKYQIDRQLPNYYTEHPFYHDLGDRVICLN